MKATTQVYTDPDSNDLTNVLNYENGISFHNTSHERFYTFTIPPGFTNNTYFDFEIIYLMALDNVATAAGGGGNIYHNLDRTTDRADFYKFQCSFVIYDVEEEELLSNEGNIVDYKRFGPTGQYKNIK